MFDVGCSMFPCLRHQPPATCHLQDEQGFQDELQFSLSLNPQPTTLNNLATNAENFHQAIGQPVGSAACRVRRSLLRGIFPPLNR
jgi:hypothetical protein